jgi:rubrerythrin
MDPTTAKRLAEGLKTAIEAEQNGYAFYQMAARSTDDEKGRAVFEQLALEELDHARYLRLQYQSLVERGQLDFAASLGRKTDLSGDHPIFSARLLERAGSAHYELSALSIGAQLEMNAVHHYKAEAEASADPDVKRFFLELAGWETGHYEALSRELESVREAYWHQNGFAPH